MKNAALQSRWFRHSIRAALGAPKSGGRGRAWPEFSTASPQTRRVQPLLTLLGLAEHRPERRYRRPVPERQLLSMSDDEVTAFLAGERRAYVATINADGTPHVVPLSYAVIDGLLTFWTDPRSLKVANLRRDARMTCLVEAGEHFEEFRAVQLTGRTELGEDRTTSERVGLALFERANGQLTEELRAAVAALVGERIALTLHPARVVTWDHRKVSDLDPSEIGR
jgi:PPOX class probable F420-dependent enzyme